MVLVRKGSLGNVILTKIDQSEELIGALKGIAVKHNISSASISLIGAVKNARIINPVMKETFIGEEMEISGNGNIFLDERGEPFVHIHASLGAEGGKARMGHIVEAEVLLFVEACIIPFKLDGVTRKKDRKGIQCLHFSD